MPTNSSTLSVLQQKLGRIVANAQNFAFQMRQLPSIYSEHLLLGLVQDVQQFPEDPSNKVLARALGEVDIPAMQYFMHRWIKDALLPGKPVDEPSQLSLSDDSNAALLNIEGCPDPIQLFHAIARNARERKDIYHIRGAASAISLLGFTDASIALGHMQNSSAAETMPLSGNVRVAYGELLSRYYNTDKAVPHLVYDAHRVIPPYLREKFKEFSGLVV